MAAEEVTSAADTEGMQYCSMVESGREETGREAAGRKAWYVFAPAA